MTVADSAQSRTDLFTAPERPSLTRRTHVAGGAYTVHRGHNYVLYAISNTRPRYIGATPAPGSPAGSDSDFHAAGRINGTPRWALTIAIMQALRSHKYWNIGIKTGHTTHVLTLRVRP
jgi:hypothetical protein